MGVVRSHEMGIGESIANGNKCDVIIVDFLPIFFSKSYTFFSSHDARQDTRNTIVLQFHQLNWTRNRTTM